MTLIRGSLHAFGIALRNDEPLNGASLRLATVSATVPVADAKLPAISHGFKAFRNVSGKSVNRFESLGDLLPFWLVTSIALGLAQMNVRAATGLTAAASSSNQFAVRWVPDSADTNRAFVEVTGLSAPVLKQLRQANWKAEQWQRLLAIHAEQGDLLADIGLPAMLGVYRVTADTLRFEPQFPLEAGLAYRATFQPDQPPTTQARHIQICGHQLGRVIIEILSRQSIRPK